MGQGLWGNSIAFRNSKSFRPPQALRWSFPGLAVTISLRFDTDAMMKPDFLIIGAQKCATSWLHLHLGRHHQIMLPADKDIEFFSYPVNLNPETSRAWLERFDGASTGMRVGDVNGAYFWTESGSAWSIKLDSFNKQIPESVKAFLGDEIQFIISLRNPVERAVSAYLHHIHHGAVRPDQKLLEVDAPLGIVDMGFFGAHLKNWLRVYPAKQFLVIRDLPFDRKSATALLSGTLEFLGVADFQEEHPFETPVYPGIHTEDIPPGWRLGSGRTPVNCRSPASESQRSGYYPGRSPLHSPGRRFGIESS
jgi:hypothetical protein